MRGLVITTLEFRERNARRVQFTQFSRVINSIDNPVRPKDDLANVWILVFGNCATQLGKTLKVVGLRNQLVSKRHRTIRIIARNEYDDIVEIVVSRRSPD
jgi:hypothetical protein